MQGSRTRSTSASSSTRGSRRSTPGRPRRCRPARLTGGRGGYPPTPRAQGAGGAAKRAERARVEESTSSFAEASLATTLGAPTAASGGALPKRKTFEFDLIFHRSVKTTLISHFGQLDILHARENVLLLSPS